MWMRHLVAGTVLALLVALAAPSSAAAAETNRFRDWAKQAQGSHYLVGRVAPDGAERWVYYQRKLCATCRWKPYTKELTDAEGRFQVRIAFPRRAKPVWRYRGYVPATAAHPRDQGRVWLACARAVCRKQRV
ncbi:MAG: hypothetical protein Q8O61_16570 [Nocardioides sp.]|nr:hypothetical protein [Nocardioides sp.]